MPEPEVEYEPAGQSLHCAEPSVEYLPAAQGSQASDVPTAPPGMDLPPVRLKLPAAQAPPQVLAE